MDYEAQLKLQALVDGELPASQVGQVSEWVARDREAAALVEELRNTHQALAAFEAATPLPESREFFWSKVQREIQRLETPAPQPDPVPVFAWWRRFLVPAFAFTLIVFAGVVLTGPAGPWHHDTPPGMETALADAGAFTYHDYSAGTTLVWLSYPADNELAEDDDMGLIE